ncbi:Soluble lytic murein transglycosylase (plasmid) [Stutzerimonas frequens]|nr:Soluble lytic murein transglycosylase [Pseudomonas mendocina]QTF59089.1 Soluble lytic murein transglycosylase [Stutzerimonas frequens]
MIRHCMALLIILLPSICKAEVPPPTYQNVAMQAGVPVEYLYAVAKTESNTQLTIGYYPWPWTLNVAGESRRFATFKEACADAESAVAKHGGRSVDIGIGQLNWGYNGFKYFASPCDSLNPRRNLEVAAMLLRQHFEKYGDWLEAAGRYHRPAGGAPAEIYKAKIKKRLQQITIVSR